MLSKKIGFVKRLANKIRIGGCIGHGSDNPLCYESLSICDLDKNKQVSGSCTSTPRGCIALYVGEEQQRFVVRTSHLSHPLFQILLEKMAEEFGFEQKDRLVVPCSVVAFRELMSAVKCNNGKFDSRCLVEKINYNSN